MSQWSTRGKRPDIHLNYNPNQINTSNNISQRNKVSQIYNQRNSPRNKIQNNNNNSQKEKILSHSIRRNYDQEGNSIIRTEIVREIEENNENDFNYPEEIIYDNNYEMISPRSKNEIKKMGHVMSYNQRISPVMLFNTPESEYDLQRSYYMQRNNQDFFNNDMSTSQRMEMHQKRYTNYNMESPYNFSNHSHENDFDSPDKGNYDVKYFRKIPIEKIKEKKPFNQIDSSLERIHMKYFLVPEGEDELYDMVDNMATLIQSNVRGFLVRKKVLRFITLAIYYQSFCDKIQDILSSHVKNEIFELLKYYNKSNNNNETSLINISQSNNKRNASNSDYYNPNNKNIIYNNNLYNKEFEEREESLEHNDMYENSSKINLRKDNSEKNITSLNNYRKLKKEYSYQNKNSINSYSQIERQKNKFHNKIQNSLSPSNRVYHYYIHSPCTRKSPHHRYYHEINSNSVNIQNIKDTDSNQLNSSRICHKCDETSKIKKQEKFYITTNKEINEEKEEYMKQITELEERKRIEEKNNNINKYSQRSYNNIFTMRKTLERDNYLSINIIKLPGKEDRSKSLTTRDIFINKKNIPNKITKVESINIKKSKAHKTDKEIEEEINRRVKLTIIERDKMEKEKKKKEEEKELNIRKERERKEKERKERLEKERKEREEKIRKKREEK